MEENEDKHRMSKEKRMIEGKKGREGKMKV